MSSSAPSEGSHEDTSSGAFSTLLGQVLSLAFQLCSDLLRFAYAILRPWAPQLISLTAIVLVLPILAFVSLSAGFVVWKTAAVSWEEPMFLQYGDGIPPYADFQVNMAANQPYDVNLHLVVPAVESNFALGNFMTTLSFVTTSNRTIVSVRRPSLLVRPPPKSLPWRSKKHTLILDIPLLSSYALGASRVLGHLEIGRQDHWRSIGKGEGRELTVLSATLQGTIRHRGVRGVFSRFPLITASIASGTFFVVVTAAVLGVFLFSSFTLSNEDSSGELVAMEPQALSEVQDEQPLRRRPSKRRSREFKHELEDMDIPLDDEVNVLRKRPSRQLSQEDI